MRIFNNRVNVVVKDQRGATTWYYVFHDLDATKEWNYKHVIGLIKRGNNKRTRDYAKALVIAHSQIVCEYGVQMMCLRRKLPLTSMTRIESKRDEFREWMFPINVSSPSFHVSGSVNTTSSA